MRLGSLILPASLSAALLSGCSFFDDQFGKTQNPYAAQQGVQYGQGFANQHCQIPTPRHPIPRGCRPEQVTIGVPAQNVGGQTFAANGFPQQPQFGQPQYTSGGYGAAVGQTPGFKQHTVGPKKRKPRLRGSLSLGIEKSISGELVDPSIRTDLNPTFGYNPQDFLQDTVEGTPAEGQVTTTTFTANALNAIDDFPDGIRQDNEFDTGSFASISFDDVWSTPASLKAGLEYIIDDRTTVFANGGYTYAEGNEGDVATVGATLYQEVARQGFAPLLDAGGAAVPGSFIENGDPEVNTTFIPTQTIASFAYNFSDLQQYDLEIGARRYFNPVVKSDGYRTLTPFVGASVGVSYVNDVDVSVSQRQLSYSQSFGGDPVTFLVPTEANSTRLYDSEWLPKGELNVGAEWQLTPGFALAAETGLRFQDSRDYADFVNADGETIENQSGDINISVPLTLRGSINF